MKKIVMLAVLAGTIGHGTAQTDKTLRTKRKVRIDSVNTWGLRQTDSSHRYDQRDTAAMPRTNKP